MNPSQIEFEIEELVLRGLPASQRHAIAESLRQELEALLAASDAPALERMAGRTDLPPLQLHLQAKGQPQAIGQELARTLYGGLTQ
ncbi:MAG: hypothetical protein E1N59_2028 [Puniceicoccaceae bacterium 5H]|nr:MAG: hypothetical protein E1N59_2028 [Puniceicoccaceae bacterium 5H]